MSNHEHIYKLAVIKIKSATEPGIERRGALPTQYPFICSCDDVRWMSLETAAKEGWLYLTDLSRSDT